jgi:hypothetical protein
MYSGDIHEVDPESVGQFTGLLDELGAKVFEGDILRYKGNSEFGRRRGEKGGNIAKYLMRYVSMRKSLKLLGTPAKTQIY